MAATHAQEQQAQHQMLLQQQQMMQQQQQPQQGQQPMAAQPLPQQPAYVRCVCAAFLYYKQQITDIHFLIVMMMKVDPKAKDRRNPRPSAAPSAQGGDAGQSAGFFNMFFSKEQVRIIPYENCEVIKYIIGQAMITKTCSPFLFAEPRSTTTTTSGTHPSGTSTGSSAYCRFWRCSAASWSNLSLQACTCSACWLFSVNPKPLLCCNGFLSLQWHSLIIIRHHDVI